MNNNDPITKGDLQSLKDFITRENRELDNSFNEKIESVKFDIESVKSDVKNLERKTDALQQGVSNLIKGQEEIENKVADLTDAVIEGFDNTERILSDWEEKPVELISKQKKDKLRKTA